MSCAVLNPPNSVILNGDFLPPASITPSFTGKSTLELLSSINGLSVGIQVVLDTLSIFTSLSNEFFNSSDKNIFLTPPTSAEPCAKAKASIKLISAINTGVTPRSEEHTSELQSRQY